MKLYNLLEVQEILGVTRRTLYRYIKEDNKGTLNAFKIGGEWRVKKEDLEAFINKKASQ